MELIKLEIMTNKYGGSIEHKADLVDSFTCWGCKKVIYLNPKQVQYKTEVKTCKNSYSPYEELGKYFVIHCVNGENYHLRETEFEKI